MEFRELLLCVDPLQPGSVLIENAVKFAKEREARLIGVYPLEFPEFPGYVQAQLPKEILDKNREFFIDHAKEAEAAFDKACASAGIECEWRCIEGERAETVIASGRLSDLLLLAGRHNGDDSAAGSSSGRMLLECGRPVLLLPSSPIPDDAGSRILLAWNARREAVRAVNDALPLLSKAEWVKVVVMNRHGNGLEEVGTDGHELCRHLARHGVKAEAHEITVHGESEGAALLELAEKENANMLVMGAYGHARWRELVIGGVTAHVLRHTNLPVLMSH